MLFTGKPELSIDAKQRLAIPAKTRTMLDQARVGNALYVIWGANGVLWLCNQIVGAATSKRGSQRGMTIVVHWALREKPGINCGLSCEGRTAKK